MPSYLLDTNVLVRASVPTDLLHPVVDQALVKLVSQDARLCVCSAVLGEYWSVMTRPATQRGGYDMGVTKTAGYIERFITNFELLPDNPAVFARWLDVVKSYLVFGVAAHDARIAAFASVYGIEFILSFNEADFARYGAFITGINPARI